MDTERNDETQPLEKQGYIRSGSKEEKREQFVAILLVTFCILAAMGNWLFGLKQKPLTEKQPQLSTAIFTEQPDIGIISVEGTIAHAGEGVSSKGASSDRIIAALRQAKKDGVKGILLKINSPGGTAAASQAIYQQVRKLRESGIKVIASMGDVAASGGYYVACSSDMIYANPATLTGSIGVIAQLAKVHGLFDKIGVSMDIVKSGKYKDIGSPFRATSEGERKMFQALIDDTYEQFLQAVAEGRKMKVEAVRPLADGRIFTGNQAYEYKMVDKMGDYTEALDKLKVIANVPKDAKVKDYSRPSLMELLSTLGTSFQAFGFESSAKELTQTDLLRLHKIPLMLYL